MKTDFLAERIGAKVLRGSASGPVEIQRVYAGDRMSDLLNQVSDTTLLVTNLSNSAIIRIVELMDVPGICLLNGVKPETGLLDAAEEHGTVLMVSPDGMFETCGRLYQVLGGNAQGHRE